jgi:hypothetical protein
MKRTWTSDELIEQWTLRKASGELIEHKNRRQSPGLRAAA